MVEKLDEEKLENESPRAQTSFVNKDDQYIHSFITEILKLFKKLHSSKDSEWE